MMDTWSLIYMAAMPVVNIFIMASIGFFLTKKGIMDNRMRQGLGQILFWVFIPALTFSKLGNSLNFNDLKIWWILPVNMAYAIAMGLAVGFVAARLLKVDPWFQPILMCVIGVGNVGNLPIILVQSLCANEDAMFAQELPGSECEEKGIAYAAFSMWVAGVFQFCVALNLMAKKTPPATLDVEQKGSMALKENQENGSLEMAGHISGLNKNSGIKAGRNDAYQEEDEIVPFSKESKCDRNWSDHISEDRIELERNNERLRGLPSSSSIGGELHENQIDESRALLDRQEIRNSDPEFQTAFAFATHASELMKPPDKAWKKKQKEIERWLKYIPWGTYLNMPTIAAAAGISVGCISALKNLLFGDTAPLNVLSQAITIMSGAMIPCMMLVLGSGLSEGPGDSNLPKRVIFGAILCRLFIAPAIGFGSVMLAWHFGIFHPPNSLFTLVLMICHCPPTALNLQTVAIINQNGESEVATLLCSQYLASLISVPIWMAIFLWALS